MDHPVPGPVAVRWEPCGAYDADRDCVLGTCVRCGWPCDEHDPAIREPGDDRYAHAA